MADFRTIFRSQTWKTTLLLHLSDRLAFFYWSQDSKKEYTDMLYSETRYPETMKQLPEDVRRTAIKITNEMLLDGDVRHHEDLIVMIAIQKAKQVVKEKSDPQSN